MANELRHNTVGAQLSQAEFEDVALHIFNSQATGDILYASSATQLTRLGIGVANTVLHVAGGIPEWSATLSGITLTAPTINGTVATTGLTLPAFIMGGGINANSQSITSLANITMGEAATLTNIADNSYIAVHGGTLNSGAIWLLAGKTNAVQGNSVANLYTTNAGSPVLRLSVSGEAPQATVTWSAVNHDFGSGTITTGGSAGVASFGPSGVTSITVKNGIITAIS